ncbi:MAG: glycosyltransferase family 10 domain-containing protein [Candidatus Helarchaeota archaeon]
MLTYLWILSDDVTASPLPYFTKFFKENPPEFYPDWSYKEKWLPFLKIKKGDNLIIGTGSLGLPDHIIERVKKSKFEQKILLIGEVPWRRKIKKIINNFNYYLTIFDKIYTYIKPLTNNENIFYYGNFVGLFPFEKIISRIEKIDFNEKLNRIGTVLSEYSRIGVLKLKNLLLIFKNYRKFLSLYNQLVGHPNAQFKVGNLKFNKLYGVRSEIARYFDKKGIIDIYGSSGWDGVKNYKGRCKSARKTLFKYKWALSIENNNIDNYFSEKPYNSLIACCVPIILGGPNPTDILPKGSFVDLNKISYKKIPSYILNDENYYRHLKIIKKNYYNILKQFHIHYKYLRIINSNEDLLYER